jgi:flavin-dependent dehydrogenase
MTACEFPPDATILDVASRADSATRWLRVRAVVDATGRRGLIARKFNLRTEEPPARQDSNILPLQERTATGRTHSHNYYFNLPKKTADNV